MVKLRVSADIGGTFTDLVFQDSVTGATATKKVLSTRDDPAKAVLEGLEDILDGGDVIDFMVHGTTVGLNAVLERRGSATAIVTTENFRHIYTIAGNDRREIFATRYRKPDPLVAPRLVFEVEERILADGSVQTALDVATLDDIVAALRQANVTSVAVCLLFSFLNPAHELQIRDYLRTAMPELAVTLSHEVSPEWREYARTSTAVTNAYIAPVVDRYLTTLMGSLEARLEGVPLHVMESNGGAMTARAARETPIQTLLSGPVGGTIGAQALATDLSLPNLICVDMGGTSFDASLVVDGEPTLSPEVEIEQLPLQMAAVDIHVIGAGGGSVAWLEGGHLRVGPRSAGAEPGPACYGRGGIEPTVTDANLALGRVDEARFAGGGMTLDLEAARSALSSLSAQLNMDATALAEGVVDIVNAKMADAIRTITVQRGIDPRDFALVAYGGAGPMHAAALARELEIDTVVIPEHPGTFSAWGMLTTDVRHDFSATFYRDWLNIDKAEVLALFEGHEARGAKQLDEEGIASEDMEFRRSVDLRYVGQEYFLNVAVGGTIDPLALRQAFDAAYQAQFGHSQPDAGVEVVSLRVASIGRLTKPPRDISTPSTATESAERAVVFAGRPRPTAIVVRDQISAGHTLEGPAIIEESSATTVLPPGWIASNRRGHLVLERTVR